jgi:chitosanase
VSIGARSTVLATGVIAVLGVPLIISVTANASDDVLLSKARPVLASSVKSADYPAADAVDGDTVSRWASVGGAGTQWLRIDLGAAQTVDRVKLVWERAYAKAYQIQLSGDGTSWTDVYSTRSGNGGTDDLKRLTGSGRYLRVLATQRGTSYGYSLREAQVYGPGPAAPTAGTSTTGPGTPLPSATGLEDPKKKAYALELISSAENSTLSWRNEFGYLEDLGDGRGYTGGIVGFCSGTSDMLALVTEYTRRKPVNLLAKYLPALRTVDGSDSHAGLDPGFTAAWTAAAADPVFQKTQEDERDRVYFDPAVTLARTDGLRALGQFMYFDAAVMHGMPGLRSIRADAMNAAMTPRQGGDETVWLSAFLDARVREMQTEEAHSDTTRVDTAQRVFLRASNLDLNAPLNWRVYGDRYSIAVG